MSTGEGLPRTTNVFSIAPEQDLLRFPVSVLTAAAIMEGVLDVLVKHYKSTGRDSRGKTCKRDSRSSRKAALKCSRGVRLDIQEVLQISDVSPL